MSACTAVAACRSLAEDALYSKDFDPTASNPPTTPADVLSPTGLGDPKVIQAFVASYFKLCGAPSLERVNGLRDFVIRHFEVQKMPPPKFVEAQGLSRFLVGIFDMDRVSDHWLIALNNTFLQRLYQRKEHDFRSLALVVYHEARHGGVHFVAAQRLAATGKSASEISALLAIPLSIAEKAVARPLRDGDPRASAADKYLATLLSAEEKRRISDRLEDAKTALLECCTACEKLPEHDLVMRKLTSDHCKILSEEHDAAFAAYAAMQWERDAFEVERQVGEQIDRAGGCKATQPNTPSAPK